MGIHNLFVFLRKKCPHVFRKIHISEYSGKRVAVDTSGLIYKFKIMNKNKWLDSFVYFVLAMRKYHIHPIFVFEGDAPAEKDREKEKRSSQRQLLKDKIVELRVSLDQYYSEGIVSEVLTTTMAKLNNAPPSLFDKQISTSLLEKRYDQLESQVMHFDENEMETLETLLDLSGIPHFISPTEAESMCASMYKEGKVDAVISNDSDICAHAVGKFLYDINALTETCVEISYQDILSSLEMTSEQFLDFCIMCGCDYNDNIDKIGPMNAYKLLKEFNCIENLPSKYDTSVLNHVRSRELFNVSFPYQDNVLCNNPISLTELHSFLVRKNSRVQYATLEIAFAPREIIFD